MNPAKKNRPGQNHPKKQGSGGKVLPGQDRKGSEGSKGRRARLPDRQEVTALSGPAPQVPEKPVVAAPDLSEGLKNILRKNHILSLTPLQEQCFREAMTGSDLLVCAETGSGKTLAYCLPLAARAASGLFRRSRAPAPAALILCPGRELCQQVARVASELFGITGKKIGVLIGGESYDRQLRHIRFGVDVVIGTPGRVSDFLDRQDLSLGALKMFVVDEVDMMLGKGFEKELSQIRRKLRPDVQSLFLTATLNRVTAKFAESFLNQPIKIIEKHAKLPAGLCHGIVELENQGRTRALLRLLQHLEGCQALIFCDKVAECKRIGALLREASWRVAILHGDLSQQERQIALNHLRENRVRFMVTTNLGSRGLDIPGLPCVINYTMPKSIQDYTHRAGRTARAGQKGTVWSLLSRKDAVWFSELCNRVGISKKSLRHLPEPAAHQPEPG